MTLFGAYDLAAQATHEAVFGETFTLTPKTLATDPNATAVADGSRSVASFTGIYSERDADPNVIDSEDPRTDRRPGVSAHLHFIEIDPRRWSINPNRGDLIARASPSQNWRVVSIDPDSDGRLRLNVERIA